MATRLTCAICREFKTIKARGLCDACYKWSRRNGTVEQHATVLRLPTTLDAPQSALPCVRCAVPTWDRGRLCADCRLVTSDLEETDRWAG